jgi:16S rRNA processing protein RimM
MERRPVPPDSEKQSCPDRKLVVVGKAVKAFGIRGEIKIVPFTESFEVFKRSPALIFGASPHKVSKIRIHKGAALVSLEGIDTRERAEELTGRLVKTEEANLPPKEEGEYYWFELIGMKVVTAAGRLLGEITQITPTGANDVLHVTAAGREILLPMTDEVVAHVDTEKNMMIVDPLEGLIPDD